MSKKPNRKLKKIKKKLHSNQPQRIVGETPLQESPEKQADSRYDVDSTVSKTIVPEDANFSDKYFYVRKDLKKIFFILLIICVVFTSLYFLGQRTNILSSTGNWLYKAFNIQTL